MVVQHPPADANGLRGAFLRQCVVVHPAQQTLVANTTRLLNSQVTQVVSGQFQLILDPDDIPAARIQVGRGEQGRTFIFSWMAGTFMTVSNDPLLTQLRLRLWRCPHEFR